MWPKRDPEIEHIVGQIGMVLTPWNVKPINFEWASYTIPGIQIETFSSASADQRKAAEALAGQLAKYLPNVSLSIDPRVTHLPEPR